MKLEEGRNVASSIIMECKNRRAKIDLIDRLYMMWWWFGRSTSKKEKVINLRYCNIWKHKARRIVFSALAHTAISSVHPHSSAILHTLSWFIKHNICKKIDIYIYIISNNHSWGEYNHIPITSSFFSPPTLLWFDTIEVIKYCKHTQNKHQITTRIQ